MCSFNSVFGSQFGYSRISSGGLVILQGVAMAAKFLHKLSFLQLVDESIQVNYLYHTDFWDNANAGIRGPVPKITTRDESRFTVVVVVEIYQLVFYRAFKWRQLISEGSGSLAKY